MMPPVIHYDLRDKLNTPADLICQFLPTPRDNGLTAPATANTVAAT